MKRPLNKQITFRIIAALFVAGCVVTGATYLLHERALQHARAAREQENAAYIQDRIAGLHATWAQAADEVRMSIEFAGLLERPSGSRERIKSFFQSLSSSGIQFTNALVLDARGRQLIHIGQTDAFDLPQPSNIKADTALWHFDAANGTVYRMVKQNIWLGKQGFGTLILFRPLDNALLREIAYPDTDIYLLWDGKVFASSRGQEGIDDFSETSGGLKKDLRHIIKMSIPWSDSVLSAKKSPVLAVRTRITEPVPFTEVVLVSFVALLAMAMLIRLMLTVWFVRIVSRVVDLRNRAIIFTRERSKGELPEELTGRDEIDELEDSFIAMTEAVRSREQDLLSSEEQYRTIFDTASDGIIIADPQTQRFIAMNASMTRMLGIERDALPALSIADIHPADALPYVMKCFEQAAKGETDHFDNLPVLRRDGSIFFAEVSVSWIQVKGVRYLAGFFRDVTERREFISQLEESERKFRAVFDNAQDGILVADAETSRFLMVNVKACEMLGYTPAELSALGVTSIHPSEVLPLVGRKFQNILEKKVMVTEDVPILRKDGSVFYADFSASPVELQGRLCAIGIFRDITERKEAEARLRELERRQKAILDNIPDMAWMKDRESRFLAVNEPFGKACGVSPAALVGKTDLDIWPAELAEQYRADDRTVMESGVRKQVEEPLIDSTGRQQWIETIKTPIYNDRGEIIGTAGISRDITVRKLAEEQIATSLREKETLLREIHHRVKNNLQIISSLLYFQAKKIKDPADLAIFHEGQDRLKSMILVHEKLYRSQDLVQIDFGDYVRSLTDQMLQSYAAVRNRIPVSVEVGEIYLPIEIALPCGMIINELLMNVFKYAFPYGLSGTALIRVTAEGDHFAITVKDTGAGLPPGIDVEKPSTFGMQLVRNLTNQLGGTVSFDLVGGTTVTINVPFVIEDRGE